MDDVNMNICNWLFSENLGKFLKMELKKKICEEIEKFVREERIPFTPI